MGRPGERSERQPHAGRRQRPRAGHVLRRRQPGRRVQDPWHRGDRGQHAHGGESAKPARRADPGQAHLHGSARQPAARVRGGVRNTGGDRRILAARIGQHHLQRLLRRYPGRAPTAARTDDSHRYGRARYRRYAAALAPLARPGAGGPGRAGPADVDGARQPQRHLATARGRPDRYNAVRGAADRSTVGRATPGQLRLRTADHRQLGAGPEGARPRFPRRRAHLRRQLQARPFRYAAGRRNAPRRAGTAAHRGPGPHLPHQVLPREQRDGVRRVPAGRGPDRPRHRHAGPALRPLHDRRRPARCDLPGDHEPRSLSISRPARCRRNWAPRSA